MGEVISIHQDDAYLHTLDDVRVWARAQIDHVGFTSLVSQREADALEKQSIEEVVAEAARPYYLARSTARSIIDICASSAEEKYSVN